MGLGKAKNVERLSEKEAIELGGEMLGEFVVFGLACLVLGMEYQRSSKKEAAKEEKARKELSTIKSKIETLTSVTEIQESQIRELQKQVDTLTAETVNKPENTGYVKRILGGK